jgi:Single-strand binding protein family.
VNEGIPAEYSLNAEAAATRGHFLGKGQQVAIEGRIQTRTWDDNSGKRQCQVSPGYRLVSPTPYPLV